MSLNKKESDSEFHFQSERERLYIYVMAAFSGLSDLKKDKGIIKKEFRVKEETIYKVFKELHKEFPNEFSGLYFSDMACMPYSRDLEHDLSTLGSAGLLEFDGTWRYRVVTPEASQAIQDVLKKLYGENNLKKFIPIAKRFRELAKEFGKNIKGGINKYDRN